MATQQLETAKDTATPLPARLADAHVGELIERLRSDRNIPTYTLAVAASMTMTDFRGVLEQKLPLIPESACHGIRNAIIDVPPAPRGPEDLTLRAWAQWCESNYVAPEIKADPCNGTSGTNATDEVGGCAGCGAKFSTVEAATEHACPAEVFGVLPGIGNNDNWTGPGIQAGVGLFPDGTCTGPVRTPLLSRCKLVDVLVSERGLSCFDVEVLAMVPEETVKLACRGELVATHLLDRIIVALDCYQTLRPRDLMQYLGDTSAIDGADVRRCLHVLRSSRVFAHTVGVKGEVNWKAAQACMGMGRTVGTGRGGVDWALAERRRKRVMGLLHVWWDCEFAEEEKRRIREELDHPTPAGPSQAEAKP